MEDKIDKLIEELRLNNKLLSMILVERMFKETCDFENVKKFGEYFDNVVRTSDYILKNTKI